VEPNPSRTNRYITGWVVAAAAVAVSVLALVGAPPRITQLTLALVAISIVAEHVQLYFNVDERGVTYSLGEAALAAALLLVPPAHVVLIAAAQAVGMSASRRLSLDKTLFNAAQWTVGGAVAALVMWSFPDVGPTVGGRAVLGALLGMTALAVVNTVALAGLMVRLGGREMLESLRPQIPMGLGASLGTTSLGIVGAALWVTNPWLIVLLLSPAVAIHLAARGQLRATSLLERLRSDHDRLTRVVDGAHDGIVLLDRSGTVQVWNPAMEAMTGLPSQLVVGQPIERVLTEAVREGAAPVRGRWLVDAAHAGSARRELDARFRHVDGTVREVRESHSLVFDERGRCTGDVVVVRDESRQRELGRLRDDFVARVSHELRTPLTPIRGFASILLRRGEQLEPAQRLDALERIVERADHLSALVEDLLLVTRLDRDQLDELVHPRPTELTPVIEAAATSVRTREDGRSIALHQVPGTGEALADPDRVRQVVEALLDNACQYTPDDTPIEVEVEQVGDDIQVRVIDHGPGIPRDQREAVFEQFHRLEDPLTMRTSGVGLGLFIGRRLAEAMHGTLHAEEPEGGRGAVLVLRLPAAEPVSAVDREAVRA
jgi:PAS domain S-box-containing protein